MAHLGLIAQMDYDYAPISLLAYELLYLICQGNLSIVYIQVKYMHDIVWSWLVKQHP